MHGPILITGAVRSGISIVAAAINHAGAWGGVPTSEDYDGRRVMENKTIKDLVMDPIINGLKSDVDGQLVLPKTDDCLKAASELADAWKRRIERLVKQQGYENGPWFYASARTCLVWPIWHAAFPSAKWVIVRRRDNEIVKACLKSKHMKAYDTYTDWAAWLDQYKEKFKEIADAGIDPHHIWPVKFINGNFDRLGKMIRALDLDWDERRMSDFLAPILWKMGVFKDGS